MLNIIFKLDKNKDEYNIWEACNESNPWQDFKKNIPERILNLCKDKDFNSICKELEVINNSFYNSKLLKFEIEMLNEAWKIIGGEYFSRLRRITGREFPYAEVTAYITTISKCPYNPDPKDPYFFVTIFAGIPIIMNTTMHELMHLHFHYYYWKQIEEEIGKDKTGDLKEALTVLLNSDFKDLTGRYDSGYECHKELRKFIEKEWKKEKDFDKLLIKAIGYLKNKKLTISSAEQIAKKEFLKIAKQEYQDFNLTHSELVVETCLILAEGKEVDKEKLVIASWLHDIGKTIEEGSHAENSIKILERECYELDEIIRDCILNHGNGKIPQTKEGKIIQVADKLSTISPELIEVLINYSLKKDKDAKEHDLEFIRKMANQGIDLLKDFK